MDFFTHSIFGALMYILFLKEVTFDYFFLAIFFAFLPDLDIFIMPFKRFFKSNYLEHRGGSHSYVIGIILSAIISVIYSSLTLKSFLIAWIIGMVFYGIHISLDLLTTTKIPCFYPISKNEYCFNVEKAGSSFTFLTSWIFLIINLLIYNISPELFLFVMVINIYTYFTLIYYLYRIVTKIWINLHLKDNQKYFPGVLPFFYIIFESEIVHNGISLRLEKKSHFSKSKLLYKNKAILDSEEMVFFKKGIELCNKYYYYAKWTILPIFFRNKGVFSVRFYFLETMIHGRTNYIQYDFDTFTQKVADFNRGYGRILS